MLSLQKPMNPAYLTQPSEPCDPTPAEVQVRRCREGPGRGEAVQRDSGCARLHAKRLQLLFRGQ